MTYTNQQPPKVSFVASCQNAVHAHTEAVLNDKAKQPSSLWPVPRENYKQLLDVPHPKWKKRKLHTPTFNINTCLPLPFSCIICLACALRNQGDEIEIQDTRTAEDLGLFFARALGLVLVLVAIRLGIYMVYRSVLRIYLWWTKTIVLYTIEMRKNRVVWSSTRFPSSSNRFLDIESVGLDVISNRDRKHKHKINQNAFIGCMKVVLPFLFLCLICQASALKSDQGDELEIQGKFIKYTTASEDLMSLFSGDLKLVLILAAICAGIYMVYKSVLRINLWQTKPQVLYEIETNNDQVVWCTTRAPASSEWFVEHRSQQRSGRAAVTTRLARVTFPGNEKPIPMCLDLIEECLEHFTGSTPTKPAIMNYMFTQTQFNLAPLEWVDHKLYAPSMVSWMLRQGLNKASFFWMNEEESIDYDEISERDRKRKYRLFLHAFIGSKKLLTFTEIVVSWIILCLGVIVLLNVGGYILATVAKIIGRGSDSFPSDRKIVRITDQRFGQTMGYHKPADKPMKNGFEWIKVPFNDSQKYTYLQSIIPRDSLPEWIGYHYDRKDGANMKRAIEQRVAVTNVVEDVYDPDYNLMHKLSDNLAELLINQSASDRVYPDRQVVVDWLERKNYPVTRKVAILKAFDDAQSLLPEDLLKQRSGRVQAFIKEEFYPQFKNPRAILARGDLAKAILGPIFDGLNHEFFKLPQTVKKVPAAERPAYITDHMAGPYFYVTDHTAFECSATCDIQKNMEHRIYRRVMGEDAYAFVAQLLEDQKVTCGNGKCIVPVSRFSGEMNTSLGNSIVNYIVIQMIQTKFNVGGNFFIEGDDGLLCFDKELDVESVRQYALSQGFNLKIARVESPGKAGFLSTYWDEDGYCYKHPLGKYLSGAVWRIPGSPLSDEDLLLARLSSLIEENPRNALLVKLFNAFCDKFHSNNQTVSIYKPDDAYFREKLSMQGVEYVRENGMLKYARPRYDIAPGSREFLLDIYDISDQLYDELSDMISKDPERAYKVVADIFIHHETDNFWQDREIA